MTTSELEVRAPAKINLLLKVYGRRPDGYHEIETVMQKLELADYLRLRKNPTTKSIRLQCAGAKLPEDETNLAFKAAVIFCDYAGIEGGLDIELEKYIPIAAGLGGGSSDAAAVLLGLNTLFSTEISTDKLAKLAASLGADVPFFISAGGAGLATGIGTKVENIDSLGDCWIVLVNPGISLSTKWVYENFRLTTGAKPYKLSGYSKFSKLDSLPQGMTAMLKACNSDRPFNDLETVSIRRYEIIRTIKELLIGNGACLALMSGSGPTVFGIFNHYDQAKRCLDFFSNSYKAVFLTRPLLN